MKNTVSLTSFRRFFVLILLLTGLERTFGADASPTAHVVDPSLYVKVQRGTNVSWLDLKTFTFPDNELNIGYGLKTLENGFATVDLGRPSPVHLGQLTTARITAPTFTSAKSALRLLLGRLFLLHRGEPGDLEIQTLAVDAAANGTDLSVSVDDDQTTTIAVLDGSVQMANAKGNISVTNGEIGTAKPGEAPTKSPLIDAVNYVQWSLYYPGVVDPDELRLDSSSSLSASMGAYKTGNLLEAMDLYPRDFQPTNQAERLYHAALLLAVGDVTNSEALLRLEATNDISTALRYVIAAVKGERIEASTNNSPSRCLGFSYYAQSRHDLRGALDAARLAVKLSTNFGTNFGFGWERLAELRFSFGEIPAARKALDRSLAIASNNAQAYALSGFLLAAENQIGRATNEFNKAINIDGHLATAWLGRGLCQIRKGNRSDGLYDLETAAMLEPTHSLLRSYLGKAFGDARDNLRGTEELLLAQRLDTNDPTPLLYLALLKQQKNQINSAIQDLQTAEAENTNRAVFRSQLLLDQDRAVATANLASVYHDAGMTDVSVGEAGRAVTDDYANPSAHLFLSDSYYNLLDPSDFNGRYSPVWFNELLLANILTPVGAGRLSTQVSQQDYSKLLQADGLGFASASDNRSDGVFHAAASQFVTFDNTSYALDLDYRHNDGVRINNVFDDLTFDATIKRQLTPNDTALLSFKYQNSHYGDDFQYYSQSSASPFYKDDERLDPELTVAWHHDWSPSMHTLLLFGRFALNLQFSDQNAGQLIFAESPKGQIYADGSTPFNLGYQEQYDLYSIELQQICQWDRISLVAGALYRSGEIQTQNKYDPQLTGVGLLFASSYDANLTGIFQREVGYSYLTVRPFDQFWITGGLAAEEETFPYFFMNPPVTSGEDTRSQVGPKASLVWDISSNAAIRGSYSRSLGGGLGDEGYRLEPTELAGFPQTFKTLISESVVGPQAAPEFGTVNFAVDLKLPSHTFAELQLEHLDSSVNQGIGDFLLLSGSPPAIVSGTPEQLNYNENTLAFSLYNLSIDDFVFGVNYKVTQSDLEYGLPDISPEVFPQVAVKSKLQQAGNYILFNYPSGFYAKFEANWYGQHNAGWIPAEPNVSFFQENIFSGYRFRHRRAELEFGILNLGAENYNLNPLNFYQELPRKRVFEGSFKLIF